MAYRINDLTPLGRNLSSTDELEVSLTGATGSRKITGAQIIGSVGAVTSVTGTSPVVSSGGATPAISIPQATTSVNGFLINTDWNTFNNKQAALVSGTNIKTVNGISILGSGNIIAGGNKASVGLPTFTSNTVPSGSTNTLVFSANVFSAAGQIIDLDFLVRSTTSFAPRLRFYVNSSNTLTGATQLVFFDGPSTINNVVRYFRRYALTLESGSTFALYGADFSTSFSDFSPNTQPFISFALGVGVITNPWILITLNNSGQLLAGTVEY